MWKILKAELIYSKYWLLKAFGFLPPLLLYFYLLDRWWLNGIIFFIGLFTVVINIKIRIKEDRLRKEMLFPVSVRHLALVRIILSTVPVIIIYGFAEFLNLIPQQTWDGWRDSGAERLMFFSLTFYLIFIYHIISDILSKSVKKSNWKIFEFGKSMVIGIMLILTAVGVAAIFNKSEGSGMDMIKIILILDALLGWLTLYTFERRKSFFN